MRIVPLVEDKYLHLLRDDCPLPPNTRCVGYSRDSGGDSQDRSVLQQQEAIREFCAAHGLILEFIYVDEARQSSSTDKRNALNDMLHDLRGRFKTIHSQARRERAAIETPFGVIVWKGNRMGRDSIESTYIKTDLRMRGLTIVALQSSSTGNAAMDALLEAFQQWQDQQLLSEISDNARRGLAEIVSLRDTDPDFRAHNPGWAVTGGYLGIMPGGVPVGFRGERIVIGMNKRTNKPHEVQRLVPDAATWERARLAWEMRHRGEPIKHIHDATKLYKTTNGYTTFFANRIYTGDLDYGGKLYENFVPALIPRDWWEAEQTRIAARGQKLRGGAVSEALEPRRVGAGHILSGLVVCGAVEGETHPMHYNPRTTKGKEYFYYECSRRKGSRGERCNAGRISAKLLESAVIDAVMREVLTPDALRPLADEIASQLDTRNREINIRLAALQEQLAENRAAVEKLLTAIETIGISRDLQARLRQREAEAERLALDIEQYEAIQIVEVRGVSEREIEEWVEVMRAQLHEGGLPAQQALRAFVREIRIVGRKASIAYALPFEEHGRSLGQRSVDLRGFEPLTSTVRL